MVSVNTHYLFFKRYTEGNFSLEDAEKKQISY